MHEWNLLILAATVICLAQPVGLAFFSREICELQGRLSTPMQLCLPALLVVPYLLVAKAHGAFQAGWFVVYLLLPVCLVFLLWTAQRLDPDQRGNWRDYLVLLVLGVVVEFHLFEPAWPAHLGWFNRIILLNIGLYGFVVVRHLSNADFDLRPRLADWRIGLRELAFYAPIAIPAGLALGFLHWRAGLPGFTRFLSTWVSIFFLVALLEETYFRSWWQNLMERSVGRNPALIVTALLFGLSHFNKGATPFNWRYVLLASLAGIFYGRAWRAQYRLFASAITHSLVDTIWLLWLR